MMHIAADGIKLPALFILKVQLGKYLEQQLIKDNVTGYRQVNGWFNEYVINKWIK
jgi:hypothetical protein